MYERLGGTPGPEDGMPQSMDIGTVLVPTLMVCGTDDPYILCSNDYVANRTERAIEIWRDVQMPHDHYITP